MPVSPALQGLDRMKYFRLLRCENEGGWWESMRERKGRRDGVEMQESIDEWGWGGNGSNVRRALQSGSGGGGGDLGIVWSWGQAEGSKEGMYEQHMRVRFIKESRNGSSVTEYRQSDINQGRGGGRGGR